MFWRGLAVVCFVWFWIVSFVLWVCCLGCLLGDLWGLVDCWFGGLADCCGGRFG